MAGQANGLVLLRLQVQLMSHAAEHGEMSWLCLVCSERLESDVRPRRGTWESARRRAPQAPGQRCCLKFLSTHDHGGLKGSESVCVTFGRPWYRWWDAALGFGTGAGRAVARNQGMLGHGRTPEDAARFGLKVVL